MKLYNFLLFGLVLLLIQSSALATNNVGWLEPTDFTLGPNNFVNLLNNDALLRGDAGDQVNFNKYYGYVRTGYNDANWNGVGGIFSSECPGGDYDRALAAAYNTLEGSQLFDTFDTVSVVGTDTLVKYTIWGDVFPDGTVDQTDYDLLYFNLGKTGMKWIDGDITYDTTGSVDQTDYDLMYFNIGKSISGAPQAGAAIASVPEPSTLALLAIFGMIAFAYRKFN